MAPEVNVRTQEESGQHLATIEGLRTRALAHCPLLPALPTRGAEHRHTEKAGSPVGTGTPQQPASHHVYDEHSGPGSLHSLPGGAGAAPVSPLLGSLKTPWPGCPGSSPAQPLMSSVTSG